MGAKKGDRVAVLADNCPEYVAAYFAVAKGSIIIVPVNATLGREGVSYIINESGANTLIFGEKYADFINLIRSGLTTVKNYIVIGRAPGIASYQELVSKHLSHEPEAGIDEGDTAWLCYTSGTTGVPKGVMLSHKNIISNVKDMIISGYPISRNEINLSLVPLSHATGMLQPLIYYKEEEAGRCFFRSVEIDPPYADGYTHLANIAWRKSDWKQAEALYRKALELAEHIPSLPTAVLPRILI